MRKPRNYSGTLYELAAALKLLNGASDDRKREGAEMLKKYSRRFTRAVGYAYWKETESK